MSPFFKGGRDKFGAGEKGHEDSFSLRQREIERDLSRGGEVKIKTNKVFKLAVLIVILIFAVTAIVTWKSKLNYSEMIATGGLLFAATAFFGVFYNLNATYIQLRKAMAKPKIKVAFNEKGNQYATLKYENKNPLGLPNLWIINEGNAVARYFQIDFIIPKEIGKQDQYVTILYDGDNYTISNINDGRYTLFVGSPTQNPNIHLSPGINFQKVYDSGKKSFEIAYKIFGDWAETQEGILTVHIEKSQEVISHAQS